MYQRETGILNTYTQPVITDPKYYVGLNSVTIQRWLSDKHVEFFKKFLQPVAKQTHTALIYAIDDAMHYEDIPLYNRGRAGFASE